MTSTTSTTSPTSHMIANKLRSANVPTLVEGFYFGVDQRQLKEQFDPNYPYSYCRVCGWLYQPQNQRKPVPINRQLPNAPYDSLKKRAARSIACNTHARQHSPAQHKEVGEVGITPEAQYRLAAFGIANLRLISTDKANEQAGLEAPIPGFWLPDTAARKVHK